MSRTLPFCALGLFAALLLSPTTGRACDRCAGEGGVAASYAPYAAAYAPYAAYTPVVASPVVAAPVTACSPCVTQTVQYVPQTTYRPYTVNVPVVTNQAMTAYDACTGCPVTVMRPV